MSRNWETKDEKYVFKENTNTLNAEIEYLIHRIKSTIGFEIELDNIVDAYKKKIESFDYFFSKDFVLKDNVIDYFNEIVMLSSKELIKCINKLDKLYDPLLSSKIVLLFIDNNIRKYLNNIRLILDFDINKYIDYLLKTRYEKKREVYSESELLIIKKNDKKSLKNINLID